MFHQQIKSHTSPIILIHPSKSSSEILTIDETGLISIYLKKTQKTICTKKIKLVNPITFCKIKNKYIYFGLENGDIVLVEKENKKVFVKVMGHEKSVCFISILNSSIFITSGLDKKLIIWDNINFIILKVYSFDDYISYIKKIDDKKVYLLIGDNRLIIFDFKKGEIDKEIFLGQFGITFIRIENNKVFFGDTYGKLNIINNLQNFFLKKEILRRQIAHDSWINNIILNKEFLITFGDDSKIKFWNSENFKFVDQIKGHKKSISASCLMEDLVYSGCLDGQIYLWSLEDVRNRIEKRRQQKLEKDKETQELMELENKKKRKKFKKRSK